MHVYERRPTGFALADLVAHARADRGAGRFAAARLVAAVILMALVFAPLGALWFLLGAALLLSLAGFVREAGHAATIRPSVVLTGTPKWDGVRRCSWEIIASDSASAYAAARRLADGLTAELGEPLAAHIEAGEPRGVAVASALASGADAEPSVLAWGASGAPRLAAEGDADGVWMRIDRAAESPVITVLTNEGSARDALTRVAWRA